MNSFSNMEFNDLLDNRFRLEEKHTPNYLAECFQRLFPTLGRMGLSTVIDEMARANHRAFNSSKLPIRGETLDLRFFFELWKRNFRFEGGIYDRFVFSDELRLAFRINPREFWEVLVRADRDMGTYLKDSIELLKYRDLPKEISLNLRLNGFSPDDKTIRLLKEKLPYSKENVTTHEIAKICLQLFEAANPADYDVRRLAEELEKENGVRRLSGEFTAIIPKKALDRLSTRCVLEFFKSKPLASNEASAMERGVYTVTEADLVLINNQGSEAFWQSIIPDKSIRERTLNMWKLAGMDSDARRFAKGKQILIATERALSDALHKHSAEMRDVYPLCGRAGISTQEADKFMAMLYLCHDFYTLPNINIDYTFIGKMKQSDARGLWETMRREAFTSTGIAKINEVGKRLVREAENQAALVQRELLVRGEPYNDQPTDRNVYDVKRNAQGGALVDPISTLKESFRNILIDDFIAFKQNFPQHEGTTIIISETIRSLDEHADILLSKWTDGSLAVTYTKDIYKKMMEAKNSSTNIFYPSENLDVLRYFNNPIAENARKVFLTVGTTQHMFGKAIDISGSLNNHNFKKDIVEFLNGTRRYTMFIYINNNGTYTAKNGGYRFYSRPEESIFNVQETQQMWATLAQNSNWFFHIQ